MNTEQAMNRFDEFLDGVSKECVAEFLLYIQRRWFVRTCSGQGPAIAHGKLRDIANSIKEKIPLEAILPSEHVHQPSGKSSISDADARHTVHVDAFLYEDSDIDDLVEEGKMSRNYCKDCESHRVAPLTFISHSASRRRIEFIFSSMLPYLKDKTLLDVGSRLGAILYGAYLNTPAKIIGVEMNHDLCKLQEEIIQQNRMNDRIQVICSDITKVPEVVQSADVVVLNNVFEYFLIPEAQVEAWKFLRSNITKKGTILVTVPSLEESLKQLETGIDLSTWVKKIPITDPLVLMTVQSQDELSEVCTYEVI